MTRHHGLAALFGMALLAAPALAQDQSPDNTQQDNTQQDNPQQDNTRQDATTPQQNPQQDSARQPGRGDMGSGAEPIAALDGLWRVDRAEGDASASAMGRVMRISRMSLATLASGTCSNPSFAASGDGASEKVAISCIGQPLATAEWNPAEPDTVKWSESGLQAVLHRLGPSDHAPETSGGQPGDQQNQQDNQDNGSE